jgi:hypothetical protein
MTPITIPGSRSRTVIPTASPSAISNDHIPLAFLRKRRHTSGLPKRSSKQKDTYQLARGVLDAIVPDAKPKADKPEKNPAAVALGRLGGLKGGKARAEKLSPAKRKAIAKKAAAKRWGHQS